MQIKIKDKGKAEMSMKIGVIVRVDKAVIKRERKMREREDKRA